MPRRRNLRVTDALQWLEARLAQPANPMWDSAASAFPVRSQLPFELVPLANGAKTGGDWDCESSNVLARRSICRWMAKSNALVSP
jgi:hypothetical protein